MPDAARADADASAFLSTVPLFEGVEQAELAEVVPVMRRREAAADEVLWRKGDEAEEMLFIVDGRVSVSLPLPGGRAVEVTTMGRGEVLGEVALLDRGRRSATASVTEPATLLSLSRADFEALMSRRHPTAFALRRRIAKVACARLRAQFAALTTSLGEAAAPEPPAETTADLEYCGPPASGYLRRLGTSTSSTHSRSGAC